MDSKNSSEALSAMEGLGFDDAAKVCPATLFRAAGLLYPLSEGHTDSPRPGPETSPGS